jgi:hypothetical protein
MVKFKNWVRVKFTIRDRIRNGAWVVYLGLVLSFSQGLGIGLELQ